MEHGYNLISDKYVNPYIKLEYICDKHKDNGILEITYAQFKYDGKRCLYCKKEKPHQPKIRPAPELLKQKCQELNLNFVELSIRNKSTICRFTCPIHIDKGIQEATWSHFNRAKYGCSYCVGKHCTTEDIKKQIENINPNIDVIGEYRGDEQPILCRCRIHGYEWEPKPHNLKTRRGCSECRKDAISVKNMRSHEDFVKEIEIIHPNIQILSRYKGRKKKIHCKCNIDGYEWFGIPDSLLSENAKCPKCVSSFPENKLADIFAKNKIQAIRQHSFKDCVYKRKLRFDFYLPELNVCVEYDGEQHYRPVPFWGSENKKANNEFEKNKTRDEIKNKYCKEKNIPLIRIPYWEKDNLECFLFENLKIHKIPRDCNTSVSNN